VSDALDSQPKNIPPFPDTIADDYEAVRADDGAPRPQREGLPRGYRMRADQHYVDQLNAPSAVYPVRMVLTADIDADASGQSDLRPLLESIRTLGIVHPLLVRRRGARYSVIAGRKRLAAAQVLRLSTVPCLIHDTDDAQAAVLAAADNLIVQMPEVNTDRSGLVLGARQAVTHHLATVRACADLAADGNPWMVRSACDLIRAHGWRAAQLVDALGLVTNTGFPQGLNRPVRKIVEQVIDGFSAEAGLSSVTLKAEILEDVSSGGLSDRELQAGLSAALLAMLPLVENTAGPTLVIKVAAAGPGSMVLEIAQSAVSISASLAQHFFDDDAPGIRPGGWSAAVGALAVKALAQRYGGSTTMEVVADGGSRMRIVLTRRPSAEVAEKPFPA
jgi:hypothetical protein